MLILRIGVSVFLLCSSVWAQSASSAGAEMAALKAAVKSSQSAGDNAWMLISSALVLMMTGPGLALFYCGLVRKKNVLSVMMQCVFLMGLMSVIWAVYGYSFAFGGDEAWLGNSDYVML